jgi:hypothetical protein
MPWRHGIEALLPEQTYCEYSELSFGYKIRIVFATLTNPKSQARRTYTQLEATGKTATRPHNMRLQAIIHAGCRDWGGWLCKDIGGDAVSVLRLGSHASARLPAFWPYCSSKYGRRLGLQQHCIVQVPG